MQDKAATESTFTAQCSLLIVWDDPAQVQAVQDLPTQISQTKLKSFLGLINYLQAFIPILSKKMTLFCEQLAKLDWNSSTDATSQHLKSWVCSTLVKMTLTSYDRTWPVIVHTNDGEYGLGTAPIQNGCPITFTSKTLTEFGTQYTNIERECLSVCFRLEKFHTYAYGRHINQNDHEPLEMTQHKFIHVTTLCLQCMLLCLQKYDYTIEYLHEVPLHIQNFI